MKIFSLGYHDVESNVTWLFSHLTKTERDFEDDVKKMLRMYGGLYLDGLVYGNLGEDDPDYFREWAGVSGWIAYILEYMYVLGYTQLEIAGRVSFREDTILSEDSAEWKEVVKDDLFNRAVAHNRKMEENL